MYSCQDLSEVEKWFDKLNCEVSWARQIDNKMTLEKFLTGMSACMSKNSWIYITLQLGSPNPPEIRYCVDFTDSKRISRFSWVICPYNKHNFGLIAKLYEKSFGIKLEDEPVPKGLLRYYKERIKNGY